jgi:hypothetical protein
MPNPVAVVMGTAALALCAASPAVAAAPGTTFPEQPDGHVATACGAVLSNPGTGVNGAAGHQSPVAGAITFSLIGDACFGA